MVFSSNPNMYDAFNVNSNNNMPPNKIVVLKTNKMRLCCSIGLFIVGLGCVIVGIVLPFVLLNAVQSKLENVSLIKAANQNQQSFDNWRTNDRSDAPALYLKSYVYNITNAENVVRYGASPIVVEIGPYVYREYKQKFNVTFSSDYDKVEYEQYEYNIFVPELSIDSKTGRKLSENDQFVTIYAPYDVFMKSVNYNGQSASVVTSGPFIWSALESVLEKLQSKGFKTITEDIILKQWADGQVLDGSFSPSLNFPGGSINGLLQATGSTPLPFTLEYAIYARYKYGSANATNPNPKADPFILTSTQAKNIMFGPFGFDNSEVGNKHGVTGSAWFYQMLQAGQYSAIITAYGLSGLPQLLILKSYMDQFLKFPLAPQFNAFTSVLTKANTLQLFDSNGTYILAGGRFAYRKPAEILFRYDDPLSGENLGVFGNHTSYTEAYYGPSETIGLHTGQVNRELVDTYYKFKGKTKLKQRTDFTAIEHQYWCGGDFTMTGRTTPVTQPAVRKGFDIIPQISKDDIFSVFNAQIYRYASFSYNSDVKVKGVDAWRYTLNEEILLPNSFYNTTTYALGSLECPYDGIPYFFHLPHFARATLPCGLVAQGTPGPTLEDTSVYFDIDPYSGNAINGELKLGLSYLMKENLPGGPTAATMVPIQATIKTATLTDKQSDDLKTVKTVLTLRIVIIVVGVVIGTILMFAGVFVYRRSKQNVLSSDVSHMSQ